MILGSLREMSPRWLPTHTAALHFAQCWDWKTNGKPSCATKRFESRNVITSDAQRVECSRTRSPIARTAPLISIRWFRQTLVFYRDCRGTGVGGAGLWVAVTLEPFEVSLWGGGCGGLLWDFNQARSVVASRCGRFVAGAVAFGWA